MSGFEEWWEGYSHRGVGPFYIGQDAYKKGWADRQEQDAKIAAGDAITPGCTMLEIAKAIREAE